MSRQIEASRTNDKKETYWIDNAFGGMPTYQLGAQYPYDFLRPIYNIWRLIPRPAHILFLYLAAAYILLLALGIPWQQALIGAFAYGFSTYMLIILQVGHNTKAQALAFMPLVLAGIIYLSRHKYVAGFLLTTLALSFQIRANHYQMTYYTLILLVIFFSYYFYTSLRQLKYSSTFKQLFLLFLSLLFAVGLNATSILATKEYTQFSTRAASELRYDVDGGYKENSQGLSFDYITEYSIGFLESFSLIVPRFAGGSSREDVGVDSAFYELLVEKNISPEEAALFTANLPTYWGSQPIVEAPFYLGITVFAMGILGLFFIKGWLKKALLSGMIVSLLFAWGKNLAFLTQWFIDYLPFYNKFRAVSSALIIFQICLLILACWGMAKLRRLPKENLKKVVYAVATVFGTLLFIFLIGKATTFIGPQDDYFREVFGKFLFDKLIETRVAIFLQDLGRSTVFALLIFGTIFAYLLNKIQWRTMNILLLALVIIDLGGIALRYLNFDLFITTKDYETVFNPNQADAIIVEDSSRFRVFEPTLGLTGGRTAYFHNAIGGYHGAKPRRFMELYERYTNEPYDNYLKMLNVKYIIGQEANSAPYALKNSDVLGNAWFVNSLVAVPNYDAMLEELPNINIGEQALVLAQISHQKKPLPSSYSKDSLTTIKLTKNKPGLLQYRLNPAPKTEQFAVFSEMYYPNGWQLTIDGKPVPIINVNYVLRGAVIPEGAKTLTMTFKPQIITLGSRLQVLSFALFLLTLAGIIYRERAALKKYLRWSA